MATVAAIRTGLKARLETTGIRAVDYRPGSINPPVAIVARQTTLYDLTFDGADDNTFIITVYVQHGDERAAQDSLDAYLVPSGATSVAAAIHGDPTLGGVVDFTRVVSAVDNGLVTYGASDQPMYLAATFLVEVGD